MAAAVKATVEPLDPLYDMNEVCERLRCARLTVYRLDDAGDVTLLRIRGKVLVAGVERLISRQIEAAKQAKLNAAMERRLAAPDRDRE